MSLPQKTQILSGPISSTLTRLTIPMVWGMAGLFSFQLVDVYFISLLGTQALAAMGFSLPLITLVMSLGLGLNIAVTAMVSKKIGSSNHLQAASLIGRCLTIVLGLAFFISMATWFIRDWALGALGASTPLRPLIDAYLGWWLGGASFLVLFSCSNGCIRASGNTQLAGRILIASGFMNALFDPVFIFGFGPIPAFGIQGAAMASVLVWLIGSITLLWVLRKEALLAWGDTNFKNVLQTASQLLTLGVPSAINQALNPVFNAIIIMMMAGFGEAAVAAYGVGVRFEPFALILAFALAASLPPFIGQNWGAGHHDRIQHAWLLSCQFAALWQAIVWVMLILVSPWIAQLFSEDEAVIAVLKIFFIAVPLGYLGIAIMMVTSSTLNALHKTSLSLLLHFARLFGMVLPMAWGLGWSFGLPGFLLGVGIGHFISALVVFALVRWWIRHHGLSPVLSSAQR